MKRLITSVVALLAFINNTADAAERPKLVVYISIDQMKAEYLDWYRAEFTGKFRRFLKNGTVFTNAHLNFAPSETGPGHASLGTRAYPARNGMPSTEWLDPRSGVRDQCVEDSLAGEVEGEGGGFRRAISG